MQPIIGASGTWASLPPIIDGTSVSCHPRRELARKIELSRISPMTGLSAGNPVIPATHAMFGLVVFVKLNVGICARLDFVNDINDSRTLVDGLVPDIATVVVGDSTTNTRHAAAVRQR